MRFVFVTLTRAVPALEVGANLGTKEWNDLYSPMYSYAKGADNQFNSNGEFEAQLQLGAKLYPEYPIRSHAEAFYQLRKHWVFSLATYITSMLTPTSTVLASSFGQLIWSACLRWGSQV